MVVIIYELRDISISTWGASYKTTKKKLKNSCMVPADIGMSHCHTLAMFCLFLLTNVGKFDPRGNLVFLLKIGHQTDRRCLAFSLLHRFHGEAQLDDG